MPVAKDDRLDAARVNVEGGDVVGQAVGGDACVEQHVVLPALFRDGQQGGEAVLRPQEVDHLAAFEEGGGEAVKRLRRRRTEPPGRALLRHEDVDQVVDQRRDGERVDRLQADLLHGRPPPGRAPRFLNVRESGLGAHSDGRRVSPL